MKLRVTSIIVVFALIFNMVPLNVFAEKKMMGNPLLDDGRDRLYSKILRTFEKKCGEDESIPIHDKFKVKFSKDTRETQVSNIPYIVGDSSILSISRRISDELSHYESKAKETAEQKGTKFEDEFRTIVEPYLRGSHDVKEFAKEIGVPVESVIESFFLDEWKIMEPYNSQEESQESFKRALPILGIAVLSKVLCLIPHSGKVLSIITSLIALPLTIVGSFFYGKGVKALEVKLELERQSNIKYLFRLIRRCIGQERSFWKNSNVFMTSIDKRDCSPFLFWNAWSGSCLSWADFSGINNLKGAPTVQEGDELDKQIDKILNVKCK